MSIEAISFLPAISEPSISPLAETGHVPAAGDAFSTWFEQNLTQLNTKLIDADKSVQKLAAGDASNLHEVMMNLQEARMSLQLMMQVRNHLLDAYHDIAQMQL